MDLQLLRKMIDRCLLDYFGDPALSPLTEEEYERLVDKANKLLDRQKNEQPYTIVHDIVYTYLTQD